MAGSQTRIENFDPRPTQLALDRAEARFRREGLKILMRLLRSWRSANGISGLLTAYPGIARAWRTTVMAYIERLVRIGWNRATLEVERGRAMAPLHVFASEREELVFLGSDLEAYVMQDDLGGIGRIEARAREVVFNAVVRDGLSIPDAMARLGREFPQWANSTLERTARTMGTFAFNTGRVNEFVDSGVVGAVEFTAILDTRVCPICRGLDGLILPLPPRGQVPPLHYSCRCTLLPVLDDDPDVANALSGAELEAAATANVAGMRVGNREITAWPGVMPGFGGWYPLDLASIEAIKA